MFQKILIPVDGSATSMKAVDTARKLIEQGSAKEVTLLHVILNPSELMLINGLYMPLNYPQFQDDLYKAAQQILEDAKEYLGSPNFVSIQLENGPPAEIICKIAEKNNFDLIIIGNRGLNRLQRILLGSVSSRVTNLAHCSVLVVK
jgi:nucleotide-binding universal stress UspA family protein